MFQTSSHQRRIVLSTLTLAVLAGLATAQARTPVRHAQLTEQGVVVCPDFSQLWTDREYGVPQKRLSKRAFIPVPTMAYPSPPQPPVVFDTPAPMSVPAPPPAPAPQMQRQASANSVASVSVAGARPYPIHPMPPRNTENYKNFKDNVVTRTTDNPISTFSIDVDTGSYTNVRRMLCEGDNVPADAVRVEEFLNYFRYTRNEPRDAAKPFAISTEYATAPWDTGKQLLMVGIKGYAPRNAVAPPANLVFLVDTSGSMQDTDKLDLVKYTLKNLAQQLRPQDHVAIVAYAGSAGLVLPSTSGRDKAKIIAALNRLEAGGSTNGGEGLELAYKVAKQNFRKDGANRVILATDGDFNVGTFRTESLKTYVGRQRASGIALTTLGFGRGNYNDEMAEQLADVGDGRHAYIDSPLEAQRVIKDEMNSVMMTIAKDMKIQIEFNPSRVAEWRLIGYENRVLNEADFRNDAVDAGEVGAGQQVTAIYELVPVGSASASLKDRRYASPAQAVKGGAEIANVAVRYKVPGQSVGTETAQSVLATSLARPSESMRFASAVVGFADLLRGGTHVGKWQWQDVIRTANSAIGKDDDQTRRQFVGLAKLASKQDGRVGIEDR